MKKIIKIATRKSPLAIWQAESIRSQLLRIYPQLEVELLPMSTQGDKVLDSPLAKIGGKGLFVKELELAILKQDADLAVHSTKDVPMELPEGLCLGVICQRDSPFDALVFPHGSKHSQLSDLALGARVGTSSLRRQCQLQASRPDIECLDLRGNVNTRLAKLDAGQYDAIILAASGLERLGLNARISCELPPEVMLPAVAQGALSIEYRSDDTSVAELLAPLHHSSTAQCVAAERAMNRRLNGGCQVPIAAYAEPVADGLFLRGQVGSVDISNNTQRILRAEATGKDAHQLGLVVAESLLSQGAASLLASSGVIVDE